jgi:cytochrome P450
MLEAERFTPPFPRPHKNKLSAFSRFLHGWNSWIHTLFEKSYEMQMGHVRTWTLDLYTVNDLEVVEEILKRRADDFPKHRIQHEILCPLLGENIFTANGSSWARQRAMIDPAFVHTRLELSFATMLAGVDTLLQRLDAMDLSQPVLIDGLMTHVTADIIFRTILSRPLDEDNAENIFRNFTRYQDAIQKLITCRIYGIPALFLARRQRKAAAAIRAQLVPLIAARYHAHQEGGHEIDDILGTLLKSRAPATQKPFSLEEVSNQVAMLFLAGHETSASALTWSLYLLARCPDLQEAIHAEVLGSGPLSAHTLRSLSKTRNVFREALRLYPPVSFLPREPVRDECLRDKTVPKGAMVTVAPWLLQRHRKIWPEPDVFNPDRFNDPEQANAIRKAYLPFGAGPRICVGQGFATQEAVLVIAAIAQKYRIAPSGPPPEPVSRITLRPRTPIALVFKPRQAP